MAAYPSIGLQHNIEPITKREIDISEAGDIRSADLGADTVYRISLTHPLIPEADRATLIAFYDTNKNNVNTITLAGEDYSAQFESDYKVKSLSATYFEASVRLVGKKV